MVGIEAEKRGEDHHTTKPPAPPGAPLRAQRASALRTDPVRRLARFPADSAWMEIAAIAVIIRATPDVPPLMTVFLVPGN